MCKTSRVFQKQITSDEREQMETLKDGSLFIACKNKGGRGGGGEIGGFLPKDSKI